MNIDWKNYISSRLSIRNNKACIKGTRVLVSLILDCLAEGMSIKEIIFEYPSIKKEDVKIAVAYTAMLARNETISIS
ncbi:MAG: DUF433 domain-containing protein [Candidatus Heimdallarchaeota archaeon]|nr:DUF433 domain-containing protein [Candidatus Heimdallarchaeota archaeon]